MTKPITPDDVPTIIGYRQPELTWQGKLRKDRGFYVERGGSIVSDFFPSIFDALFAYPQAIIGNNALGQLTNGEQQAVRHIASEFPRAGAENLVRLSEKFYTHPSYDAFYDAHADTANGFTGIYDIIIDMGEVLTRWEEKEGGKEMYEKTETIWDDLVDSFVDEYFDMALASDGLRPDPQTVFQAIKPELKDIKRPAALPPSDCPEPR